MLSKQGKKWNNLVHNPIFQALKNVPSRRQADTKQRYKNLIFNMNILLIEMFSRFSQVQTIMKPISDANLQNTLLSKHNEDFIS